MGNSISSAFMDENIGERPFTGESDPIQDSTLSSTLFPVCVSALASVICRCAELRSTRSGQEVYTAPCASWLPRRKQLSNASESRDTRHGPLRVGYSTG